MQRIRPSYRQLAEDCIDMATRASPEDREKLHFLAELWLGLATEALAEDSEQSKRAALSGKLLEIGTV